MKKILIILAVISATAIGVGAMFFMSKEKPVAPDVIVSPKITPTEPVVIKITEPKISISKLEIEAEEEKEMKEEKEGEEPLAGKFSSPENTFNAFLEAEDTDLYRECCSQKSLKQIEADTYVSIRQLIKTSAQTGETTSYRQCNYKVVEKTDEYAIMEPQKKLMD